MHKSLIICLLVSLLIPVSNALTATCGSQCICNPTYITCQGSSITEIPSEVLGATLSNLNQFICSTCDISTLLADSFILYTSLNTITIQYSGLSEIEPNAFSGISSQLNYLDLSHNSITTIKQHFFTGLTLIGNLDLQQNSITDIELGSFDDLLSLSTLTLKNNQITNLPDLLFTSTILTQFDITNNQLFALTSRPFPTTVYVTFYLSNNNIARLHSNISSIFNSASRVLLNGNPLICDCYIKDLQSEIQDNPSLYADFSLPPTCGYPPVLANSAVSDANIPSGGCYSVCLNIQCHTSATCSNVDDWPVCACNSGFAGDGYDCLDACDGSGCQGVSECNYDPVTMNTSCVCPTGYTLDMTGNDCTQINECLDETSCPVNSTCTDNDGSYVCDCFEGYELSSSPLSCDDINECSLVNNCTTDSTCLNTIGSYLCVCMEGFAENSTGFCEDIDECSNSTICHLNSYCINTIGAYSCGCNPGYEGSGLECTDVDECQDMMLFDCPANSMCQNTMGNYSCNCNPGYEGSGLECTDVDECQDMMLFDCPANSMCQNTMGNYSCNCNPGYEEIGLECTDVDECQDMMLFDCPANSMCQNTMGNYSCNCNPGYEEIGLECTDVDECLDMMLFDCPANSMCQNTMGNYSCNCNPGYEEIGLECTDVDECLDMMLFDCPANSMCQNTMGNYSCNCNPGYEEIGLECTDVDECQDMMLFDCPANSMCQNTMGNYSCNCNPGYEEIGLECTDVDECLDMMLFDCPANSMCQNTMGNYSCNCNPGYEEIGLECTDVDECLDMMLFDCPLNSMCQNTMGNYSCNCNPGYEEIGLECTDVDECQDMMLFDCPANSMCQNTMGNYSCNCNPGYEEFGLECADVDECLNVSLFNCPLNSTCQNELGSYRCDCDFGYEMMGMECIDIGECRNASLFNCPPNSMCQNDMGSYSCECNLGYENISLECIDINECQNVSLFICPPNSACENEMGSYRCDCDPGYQKIGLECFDIDECLNISLFTCQENSICQNTVGNYTCECVVGFGLTSPNLCQDIDECSDPTICQNNSYCNNTIGDYFCECDPGYEDISEECMDIDECLDLSLYTCQENSLCQNTVGNYTCECETGFELTSPNLCQDIDECSDPTICQNNSYCNNTIGDYFCECNLGYEDISEECIDIDECQSVLLFSCPPDSMCQNEMGSYRCECDPGYENASEECIDIDECLNISLFSCQENSFCQNTKGNYTCECETGFELTSPNLCQDIDECSNSTICQNNSYCNNTIGAYFCECNLGYEETAGECIDIDECSDTLTCPSNSNCSNYMGSFECICHLGYETSDGLCIDIDECLTSDEVCQPNSACMNSNGSYSCPCNDGYEFILGKCVDYDECDLGTDSCSPDENCTNLQGSYTCVTCQAGFDFVEDSCEDINECAIFTDLCIDRGVISGTCVNTNGSYICDCLSGFESLDNNCIDINECENLPSVCHTNSVCENDIGLYSCTCVLTGFEYTGLSLGCSDINECMLSDTCPLTEYCTNTIGGFSCSCLDGYFRDISGVCIDNDECIAQSDLCNRTSTDCINTYGSYTCVCKLGFAVTSNELSCDDINECGFALCGVTADCINSIGSYSCNCDLGYKLNSAKECVDINECSQDFCPENSLCYNNQGSHACVCDDGFYTLQSGSESFCANFLQDPYCEANTQSGFTWPDASSNSTTMIICPNNMERFAGRYCSVAGEWELPDISKCISVEIALITDYLADLSPIDPQFTAELVQISIDLTAALNTTGLLPSDYLHAVELFQTLTSISEEYILLQMSFIPTNVAAELFEVASTIVNTEVLQEISEFDTGAVLNAITDILGATESLTQNLVYTLFSEGNESRIIIETDNILVDIQKFETEEGFVISFNTSSGDTVIDIPYDSIDSSNFVALDDTLKNASIENCQTAASFFSIKNIQQFLSRNQIINIIFDSWYCGMIEEEESPGLVVNSDHVSAAITAAKCSVNTDKLATGILVVFEHTDTSLINSQCVYTTNYTVAATGNLQWETVTCTKLPMSNSTHTFCNCTHLTSFAILMSPDPYYSSGVGMSVFSYFSLGVSIIFLIISLALHFMKLAITEAVLFVHRNLILSILLSQVIFVFGIERNELETLCLIIAALLHYILLVSFLWMLIEAINALILIKRPFTNQLWLKISYACVAYLTPLVVVSVTLGVSICDYGHYPMAGGGITQGSTTNCWLPRRNGRYWAFIGPALLIIAINCILLFAIITIIMRLHLKRRQMRAASIKSSQTETLVKGLASAVRATVLMVPILGITWIFGVFALNSINVVVSQVSQWLFLVFNCYQGVFIFMFYCLMNEEVRAKFQLLILEKILRKRTNQEDLKEHGFLQIARGGSLNRSPIINRKSSQLSTERDFKPNIRLNILNVSGGTFASENREVLSNNFKY